MPAREATGSRPRALFFGTSQFACSILSALLEQAEVSLVVTQPDRPAGRGLQPMAPPVKLLAERQGLQMVQPAGIRGPEFAEKVRAERAEVAVVAAYGRILPPELLRAPRLGCVNVHASLLPRHRGAAPVQRAILSGDGETGVTLMQMDEGMDTGGVLARLPTPIEPDLNAEQLFERLAELGARLLREQLPRLLRGELRAEPQDERLATLAPPLSKPEGRIDFNRSARELHDLVRGLYPWPGAFCRLGERRLKLHRTHLPAGPGAKGAPGEVVAITSQAIQVACGSGLLAIDELQLEGKRRMGAAEFAAGNRIATGDRLGEGG